MGEQWVKALGIDYGTARIGLAASDDIGMLAHPLETVAAKDLEKAVDRIAAIILQRQIRDVVVGLPVLRDGEEGDAVRGVRKFVKKLRAVVSPGLNFHEQDERYSTVNAMEKLQRAGYTEKSARSRIDQAAAVEILQQWLDRDAEFVIDPRDEG